MSRKKINIDSSPSQVMRSIIQRIATGPELSKDISQQEARIGIRAILNDEVDSAQAAVCISNFFFAGTFCQAGKPMTNSRVYSTVFGTSSTR